MKKDPDQWPVIMMNEILDMAKTYFLRNIDTALKQAAVIMNDRSIQDLITKFQSEGISKKDFDLIIRDRIMETELKSFIEAGLPAIDHNTFRAAMTDIICRSVMEVN